MPRKRILLFCLLTLGVWEIKAQNASVASGGDGTGAGGSVAYSVGQVVYTYQSGASGSVNQGVQQPYELLSVGVSAYDNISLSMAVFPNPSVSTINLNVGEVPVKKLELELFDLQGKLLFSQTITNSLTSIKMEEYNAGSYLLKIKDEQKELKTFKIIKN